MLVVPLPTDRYLDHVVSAAQSSGYAALMVVLVRTADAPDLYDRLIKDWTSIHDVTGEFLAVLCPDPEAVDPVELRGTRIAYRGRPVGAVGALGLRIEHSSIHQGAAFERRFSDAEDPWMREEVEDIARHLNQFARARRPGSKASHQAAFTEAVSRCASYFGIGEDRLPALLFLCFWEREAVLVSVRPDMSLYRLSKSIVEGLDDRVLAAVRQRSELARAVSDAEVKLRNDLNRPWTEEEASRYGADESGSAHRTFELEFLVEDLRNQLRDAKVFFPDGNGNSVFVHNLIGSSAARQLGDTALEFDEIRCGDGDPWPLHIVREAARPPITGWERRA